MERFTLTYSAQQPLPKRALIGVVGSGDLQVIYEPTTVGILSIEITTSVNGSQAIWQSLFDRLKAGDRLPSGQLHLNDFGATPGVALLRIEQVFEEASYA